MRWAAKHAGKYILVLVMLVCFGHILAIGTELGSYGTSVVYYLKDTYSLDTVQNMRKNDEALENYLPFTATGSLDQQTFTNNDLGKSLTCTLTYIYGSSENLCTSTGELMEDDLNGCVLSTEAAWKLFGESSITGGILTYNEKNYYVRGVYEDTNAVVILPAETVFAKKPASNAGQAVPSGSGGDADYDAGTSSGSTGDGDASGIEAAFGRIVIKPGSELNGSSERTEYLQAFENRWGLTENKTDCLVYQRLAAFFMFLLPALILITVIFRGVGYLLRNRYRPFWLIAGIIGLAVMLTAFFVICQAKPSIPADMIPNTWSDFDFWGEKITTFKNSIQHILFIDKSEVELGYYRSLTSMVGYATAAVIMFFAAGIFFKPEKAEGLYGMMLAVCVTELIAVYLLHRSGVMIEGKRMMLYLWPYFVIGQFIFRKKDAKVDEKTVDRV